MTLLPWACTCADIAFDVTQYTVTPQYYTNGGCRSHLYRLVLDLPSRTISSCTRLLRRTVEFPAINNSSSTGRPYRTAYFAADAVDHDRAWGPAQVGREGGVGPSSCTTLPLLLRYTLCWRNIIVAQQPLSCEQQVSQH